MSAIGRLLRHSGPSHPPNLGISLGLAGTLGATRVLSNMLFGVSPTDPATLVAAGIFLASVALAAAYLPARRATRLDPMTALRVD